jgi:hypothetical protein
MKEKKEAGRTDEKLCALTCVFVVQEKELMYSLSN